MSLDLLSRLRADGIIDSPQARLEALTGGVSSDIYLVSDGNRKFVVKQALEKLKVEADWFADVSRNETERLYIETVSRLSPGSVPKIIARGDGYFAMEYLGDGYVNWKHALLQGRFEVDWAQQAGALLGKIHAATRDDQQLAAKFDKMTSFRQLRIEPYLVATGKKHPDLQPLFSDEAERLKTETSAVVHGDFSPKNMLVSKERLVLLDCEVACFADPAFDVAFLFTHLFLKVLHHKNYFNEAGAMLSAFCRAYGHWNKKLENRVTRLLFMLLLARVDGKSPVEYLVDPNDKDLVRRYCRTQLLGRVFDLEAGFEKWIAAVRASGA